MSLARVRLRHYCLLLSLSLLATASAASEVLNFQHYGIRDGLPQTQVRVIEQDADGYLWVGTYGGLGRYNGRDFTVFTTSDGLSSNTVEAIASTSDGRLWVGTTNGLCFLTAGTDRFYCISDARLGGGHVQALLPGSGGLLWAGTTEGLVSVTLNDEASSPEIKSQVTGVNVTSLAPGGDGAIWIGTRNGLLKREPDGTTMNVPMPASDRITALLADENSRLWIGTEAGLYVRTDAGVSLANGLPEGWRDDVNRIAKGIDGTLWAATDQGVLMQQESGFTLLTPNNGLQSQIVFTLFVDREGILFIGHDDGMSKYSPGTFTGYTQSSGLLHYFVRTINEDAQGRLWLGTRAGAQVVPFDGERRRFDQSLTITAADGLTDTRIYSIAFPEPDAAWLATGDGVALWREGQGIVSRITREDGLPDNATQALFQDEDRLWIGTNHGVRYLQDDTIHAPVNAELAAAYVYRIARDTSGRLWFGSQERGVFVQQRDGRYHQIQEKDGLTNESIWDLAADDNGGMWIGSNGAGLFHIGAGGNITQYTEADGLVDNFVWQLLVDRNGDIWGYTNRGIFRFDGESFSSYDLKDGLLHLEGGATGAWESGNGQLWFASADGLMRYNQTRERTASIPPAIVIEQVTVGGVALSQGAALPNQPGNISIEYAALSFRNEDQLEYRYRLSGADEEWSEPVAYRPITFASLGGGNYTFEVQARNPEGEWSSESAHFGFSVEPPAWQRWWFWLLSLVLLTLLVWLIIRLRLHQVETHRRELKQEVAERTRELQVANEKLQAASVTDPLTGLNNRRFLTTQIGTDVAQTRRLYRGDAEFANRDILFIMIDLDHFKDINDKYGHSAGDRVLKRYAELLPELIRESDYVVRWGGEEFMIIARQTEASMCNVIVNRINERTRKERFVIDDDGTEISCTCSIGVSHFPFLRRKPDTLTWEQVLDIADIAVYMAKALGRDGWVAIHGMDEFSTADGEWLMHELRSNLAELVESGKISVTGSSPELPSRPPVPPLRVVE